ncbi:MAG: 2,3-diphosphoglycerate synthetase, partial [Euzebyales bacterium]|nr:2,3-diphosphoglycerate synthetase [Euzebyales bacterium]
MTRRAVVLVDGEHYPPVIQAALAALPARGIEPVAALFLGGWEKVAARGAAVDVGVPSQWVAHAGVTTDVAAAAAALAGMIAEYRADVVVDMSDEPVLDPRRRLQLAARVLLAGLPYEGAD